MEKWWAAAHSSRMSRARQKPPIRLNIFAAAKINHIRLAENGETRPLTQPQRQQLLSLAHKTPDISLARIRKELALPETVQFNGVRCRANETLEESEKGKFACLPAYHKMRRRWTALWGRISSLSISTRRGRHRAFPLQKRGHAARKADGGRFKHPRSTRWRALRAFQNSATFH